MGLASPPTLSAGVVIVNGEPPAWRYLLLRAYRYWDFPKGRVEPNETPLAAAMREAREETGLTTLKFRWGHEHYDTPRYNNKVARYFLAWTRKPTWYWASTPYSASPNITSIAGSISPPPSRCWCHGCRRYFVGPTPSFDARHPKRGRLIINEDGATLPSSPTPLPKKKCLKPLFRYEEGRGEGDSGGTVGSFCRRLEAR